MSSQIGLESQFSPGISSHNRPSGSRFEASKCESKTSVPVFLFNILTSTFLLNKPCVLFWECGVSSKQPQSTNIRFANVTVQNCVWACRLRHCCAKTAGKCSFPGSLRQVSVAWPVSVAWLFNTRNTIVNGTSGLIIILLLSHYWPKNPLLFMWGDIYQSWVNFRGWN